jgi:ribosomal protein S18 acetylase RimI-like enzyme
MIEPLRLTAGGLLEVRPARTADARFAEMLYLETMERAFPPETWDEAWMRGRFRAVYRRKEAWILMDGGAVVGWLQVAEGRRQAALRQIHLVAGHRNRGIGTAIIRELQGQAARQGKVVVLRVMRRNPAEGLYRRLGFVTVRETPQWFDMRWRPPEAGG